jgi:hypothetical protein
VKGAQGLKTWAGAENQHKRTSADFDRFYRGVKNRTQLRKIVVPQHSGDFGAEELALRGREPHSELRFQAKRRGKGFDREPNDIAH